MENDPNDKDNKKPLPIVSVAAVSFDGGAVLLLALGTLIANYIGLGIGWLCYLLCVLAVLLGVILGIFGIFKYLRTNRLGLILGMIAFAMPAILLLVLVFFAQNGIAIIRFM